MEQVKVYSRQYKAANGELKTYKNKIHYTVKSNERPRLEITPELKSNVQELLNENKPRRVIIQEILEKHNVKLSPYYYRKIKHKIENSTNL